MLLVLLLSACFTSCIAQTMSFTTAQADMTTTDPSFSTIQPSPVDAADELSSLAFLHTQVESTLILNETSRSLDLVLDKISSIIQAVQPDAVFKLTLKSFTEV